MTEIRVTPGTTMLESLIKTPQVGLCELIWNAFDEDAKTVTVRVERNDLGGLDLIEVEDDGNGMNRQKAAQSFSTVGDSWKLMPGTKSDNGRPVHGKHGRGRYAAFSLGTSVNWVSTSEAVQNAQLVTIQVEGNRSDLAKFQIADVPLDGAHTGTRVVIGAVTAEAIAAFDTPEILRQRILTEFALHLERHQDFSIKLLGAAIDPSAVIANRKEIKVSLPPGIDGAVTLTVIEWNLQNVERRLYLCTSDLAITGEMPPKIQAVGAEFTAYLAWDGFNRNDELLLEGDTESPRGQVLQAGRNTLRQYLTEANRRREADTVAKWKSEGVYPYSTNPTTPVDKATRDTFNVVAMAASRTVDESKTTTSKAMALSLLKETFENNPEALLPILKQFSRLNSDRIKELSDLLERTTLTHLIAMGKEVGNRVDFIQGLNALIFDKLTKKTTLERKQLHRILAHETWIFGEEWSLTGDDERLNEVLKKFLVKLGLDVKLVGDGPVTREDGTDAIPDLVLGRQLETRENHFAHLVVELKRPSHRLNDDDVTQLRSYASAITNDERFDQPNSTWEFWLVGNETTRSVDEQRAQENKPFGVVQDSKKYRLIVKKWAEVIGDVEHRLKFVQRSLQYESGRDSGLAAMREKYTAFLPESARTTPTSEAESVIDQAQLSMGSENDKEIYTGLSGVAR
ncbi:ATP-binding protein [Rhodococcus sp. no. 34]